MFGIFGKHKSLNLIQFPRDQRHDISGQVYIKRPGKVTLKGSCGNFSEGGLYVELYEHDLERGKKVEIILVRQKAKVREISRMMGIVIRIQPNAVALVTYKKQELHYISEEDLE